VLPGFTVFDADEAVRAGRLLLRAGGVRLKSVTASGGWGQVVARDERELRWALRTFGAEVIARDGLVLERNLVRAVTYSIGLVMVAGLVTSYSGVQTTTPSPQGLEVYGGTELRAVRGDLRALMAATADPDLRRAVGQALVYDEAARRHYGVRGSRRNYDVIRGEDEGGRQLGGVLEPSWRLGGATGAELTALRALAARPDRRSVRAACVERFGSDLVAPPGATVHFAGEDPSLGPMLKYARELPDAPG
jgi:hypothetical protein